VFTARYALSPYIKQIRFVFKGLRLRCVLASAAGPFSTKKNQHSRSSLSSCRCFSLFVRVNVLKHLDTSFSESKPLSHQWFQAPHQYWKSHGHFLRLRLRFVSVFKAGLLPNVERFRQCDPEDRNSATRKRLQHCKHEFARVQYFVW
jgi:hypothetical protein